MITLKVKARIVEFTSAQSVTVEYTVDTVQNDTGAVIETLGPVITTGTGPNDITGDLIIDLSGIITMAVNRIAATVAAGSN